MAWQYTAVAVILLLALLFMFRSVRRIVRRRKSGDVTCLGCSLSEHCTKKPARKRPRRSCCEP